MIWSRRAALNGVQLDEVDPSIVIQSIELADGRDNISAVGTAYGYGQRVTGSRRDTLEVTVKFGIDIRKDNMAGRVTALEAVNAWAATAADGAWLTVNYRENRRLWVMLAQAPGEGSAWDWAREYSITFRAYCIPYWEDETPAQAVGAVAQSGSMVLGVPGNTKTVAEIRVANKSGATITSVNITVAGQTMSFTGLSLGGSQALIIDHVLSGKLYYLRARIGNVSVLAKRTGANDFIVRPGNNSISWSASRAVQVTASVRGRYL